MAIGSDYPTPVTVNGFTCKNCTDVDYAKKHIDPAHPKSGPYGINAKDDPAARNAVIFGGALSSLNAKQNAVDAGNEPGLTPTLKTGTQLDLSA